MPDGQQQCAGSTGNPSHTRGFVVTISSKVMIIISLHSEDVWLMYALTVVGKPHRHPSHPDYVPSVFPNVYKMTPRIAVSKK